MTFAEWIAQLVGAARIGTATYSLKPKLQEKKLFWRTVSTALYAAQYLILGFMSGAAVMGVSAVRSLAFYGLHKKGKEPKSWILGAFTAVSVVAGVLTWKDAWSFAPILSSAVMTYGQWQRNPKVSDKTLIYANLILAACNLFKGAYVDFAGTTVISAIGIVKIVRDECRVMREFKQYKQEMEQSLPQTAPEKEEPKRARDIVRDKLRTVRQDAPKTAGQHRSAKRGKKREK